ncbi:B2 protein-like [Phalaenopsis equestris]|uniref:B2 protein-like n=1 Tax=Phalaenopsis equestris TaxID=78828 RepID=UPI0009E1A296|nr:B2 protein-like [Phalaenopsis equestris]
MDGGRDQSTFWNFSDQLRLHTAGISNLSLGDSIWSDPLLSARRMEDRRNMDAFASSDAGWKMGFDVPQKLAFTNNNFNRYNNNNLNSASSLKVTKDFDNGSRVNNYNGEIKNYFGKPISNSTVNSHSTAVFGGTKKNNESIVKVGKNKKNSNSSSKDISNNNNNINTNSGSALDKRFKTLPPSEALPRGEAVGGYIFVCNNETMEENLKRQLFGLPPRYRDSVRAITPGLPIFLYNYSTHQLHGIFEAASFGGTNIDPAAWEDKKHPGESRFPAQIKVVTRKNCEPLEEDSFRPILHHYDGPKFRLELSVPEALALLDVFTESSD